MRPEIIVSWLKSLHADELHCYAGVVQLRFSNHDGKAFARGQSAADQLRKVGHVVESQIASVDISKRGGVILFVKTP